MMPMLDAPALPRLPAAEFARATQELRARAPFVPRCAIFLETPRAHELAVLRRVQSFLFEELAGTPHATNAAQACTWHFGELSGKKIVIIQRGDECCETAPLNSGPAMIHFAAALGSKRVIFAQTAYRLSARCTAGDIMIVDDHINWRFANPLRGQHRKEWGERWPDLHAPYAPLLQTQACETARTLRIPAQRGVVFAVQGPSLPTAAEIQLARRAGADALTHALIPEVLVAISRRMQVLALLSLLEFTTPTLCNAELPRPLAQLVSGIVKHIG